MLSLVETSDRATDELRQLDLLVLTLERANDALRFGSSTEGDEALADGLNVLGTCYGVLSPESSPEACGHLEAAYDACLRGLGDAYGGQREALETAIAILRSIRSAISPTILVSRAA